jgi:hypothetical protein
MCQDGNGNLMQICMDSTQLEIGSYEPFLFLDYKSAGASLLNDTWMTALWEHLSLCKGTIMNPNPWLPRPKREYDMALMAIAMASDSTDKQNSQINACIIYLQFIPPSEISTFNGLRITQLTHDGNIENVASAIRWPDQQGPPKHGGTHGKSSESCSRMETASSSDHLENGHYTNTACDHGNGMHHHTQTPSLNGQDPNGSATTANDEASANTQKTEIE